MIIAVYGPPGAGKTTIAQALLQPNVGYVSSGDLARKVDPESLAKGQMADRPKLAVAFEEALGDAIRLHELVVVDGLPRDSTDILLLPHGVKYMFVTCTPSVSIQRQLDRGRPGDDPDVIRIRTADQFDLLGIGKPRMGWAASLADINIDTTYLRKDAMVEEARAVAEEWFPKVFSF